MHNTYRTNAKFSFQKYVISYKIVTGESVCEQLKRQLLKYLLGLSQLASKHIFANSILSTEIITFQVIYT